jgi:ABC-type dipeptide/oligopeptide/nickel transport system permease subunit
MRSRESAIGAASVVVTAAASWRCLGWERVDDALLTAAALASVVFTLMYWRQTRGFMNRAGRAVLWVQCALSAVLAQNTLSVWTGQDYPGRDTVRTVLYGALVFALARLTATALAYRKKP